MKKTILILFLCSCCFAEQPVNQRCPVGSMTSGLTGLWPMDEALWDGTPGEVKDISGNGQNGVRGNNATTTATNAKFGRAGTFERDTDDYISLPNQVKGAVGSLGVWLKPNYASTVGSVGGNLYLFDTSNEQGRYLIYLDVNSDKYTWYIGGGQLTAALALSHTIGEVLYFVITWDTTNDNYYAYKNGIEIFSDTTTNMNATSDTTLIVGTRFTFASGYDGLWDDLATYNRVLSPAEIKAEYHKKARLY